MQVLFSIFKMTVCFLEKNFMLIIFFSLSFYLSSKVLIFIYFKGQTNKSRNHSLSDSLIHIGNIFLRKPSDLMMMTPLPVRFLQR